MAKPSNKNNNNDNDNDNEETVAAGASAKGKAAAKPEAKPNAKLVALVRSQADAESKATGILRKMVEFVRDNEIERDIIVASIMEARNCEKLTAASQASRIMSIVRNEEVADKFIAGEINVTDAIKNASVKQANPNEAKAKDNAEASLKTAVAKAVDCAKRAEYELSELLAMVRAAGKKGGLV